MLRRQMTELVAQIPAIEIFAGTTARAARRGDLSFAVAETAAQSLRDRQSGLAVLEQQITEQTIALELLAGGPSEGWTR